MASYSLNLIFELLLLLFDLPIDRSLGFLMMLTDGLSFGKVDELKLVPNAPPRPEQFISAAAKLLDLWLLADLRALLLGQVDQSAHPVGRMDQLRSRTRPPAYHVSTSSFCFSDPPLDLGGIKISIYHNLTATFHIHSNSTVIESI